MIQLPTVRTYRDARSRLAKFNRSAAFALCQDLMAAKTLNDCATLLRVKADELPHWTYRLDPDTGQRHKVRGYWRAYFTKLSEALFEARAEYPIFVLDGNVKLPFVTFSTLPVFTCPGMGECGRWCYSLKGWRCAGSFVRQVQNTLLLKHRPTLISHAFLSLPKRVTLRLYVDGDFDSYQTLWFWMRLLRSRQDIKAYGYSKAWDIVHEGRDLVPTNYVLNLSSGGRKQKVTAEAMENLPFVRGWFKAVKVPKINDGSTRYESQQYHDAVKLAAPGAMSCPGKCGDCHACGDIHRKGLTIAIGIH